MHHDTAVLPPDLDVVEDTFLDTDLLLSTHRTVVVQARIAGPMGRRSPTRDVGLVIARQHCAGDRPSRRALIDAARRCAERAGVAPEQIQAHVEGRWLPLLLPQPTPSKGSPAMNTTSTFIRNHAVAACAGLLALAGTTAAVAGTPQENYRQERANCMAGRTSQDRATCLREAGAALQESRRNGLVSPTAEQQASNAVMRCQRQPEAERADCVRLARGEGTSEGTVAEGAIVRQIATLQAEPTGAGK